jgi:uncharacterized protein (DUF302 family)
MDIVGITDPALRRAYKEAVAPIDAMIEKKLGGKKGYVAFHGTTAPSMMQFEIPFEAPEDIDDFLDEFQETFEAAFELKGYVIAGFYNVKESFNNEKDVMPGYTSFWVYNLCHIPFSYTIFDGENALPIAGIFAPCDMYVYVRRGENRIVIGMPRLHAWAAALGVTDKKKLAKFNELDTQIPRIVHSLGGKDLPEGNPLHFEK